MSYLSLSACFQERNNNFRIKKKNQTNQEVKSATGLFKMKNKTIFQTKILCYFEIFLISIVVLVQYQFKTGAQLKNYHKRETT